MSVLDTICKALADQGRAMTVDQLDRAEAAVRPTVKLAPGTRLQRDQLVTLATADIIAACDLAGDSDPVVRDLRKGSVAAGTCPDVMVRVRDVLHLLRVAGGGVGV